MNNGFNNMNGFGQVPQVEWKRLYDLGKKYPLGLKHTLCWYNGPRPINPITVDQIYSCQDENTAMAMMQQNLAGFDIVAISNKMEEVRDSPDPIEPNTLVPSEPVIYSQVGLMNSQGRFINEIPITGHFTLTQVINYLEQNGH